MNVLHLDEQRGWRGGEQQVAYLVEGLIQRGHRVWLCGRPEGELLRRCKFDGLTQVPLPLRGEWDIFSARRLARVIRDEHIDIVHAHTSHSHTIACMAVWFAKRGVAVVSRRVDFVPSSNRFSRWKYRWPRQYIAISRKIAQVLEEFGVPAERIAIVHSAIDPARFDVPPLPRESLPVPADAFLIGNVAALVGHKDQQTLLRAMPLVIERLPHAHLLIAGEGKLRGELEALARELNVQDHVHFLGYRKDVPQLLRALDLFVLSSKEEGLGTSVLDAMAAGVPVVATQAGGIPEMVRDAETGLLVPVGDAEALAEAMLRMAVDGELVARCKTAAEDMVGKEFVADRMVEENVAVYEALLGGGTP
jgi:glycosyltransferase involved in cell wall biosynthesis